MPALTVDSRSHRRLSVEAHAYSVPVVRETPRPLLGSAVGFTW